MNTTTPSRMVAVAGTSHSPMLTLDPELIWPARAQADSRNNSLYDVDGEIRPYAELAAKYGDTVADQITPEVWRERHGKALAAIDRLGRDLRGLDLDLVLVVGDDQHEMFDFDNIPSLAIYYGNKIKIEDFHARENSLPREGGVRRMQGMDGSTHPADPDAARQIIASLMADEFDVSCGYQQAKGFGH